MQLGDSNKVVETCDEAFAWTLSEVLRTGHECSPAGGGPSVGSGRKSKEIINFSLTVLSPLDRLIYNPVRKLNLPAAVARFVWMMAASDRLADIAFYEPKSKSFSDNGVSIPGSSYGQRILSPRPGLNQLDAAIRRLKDDQFSRRAAISVYQAEDAVRDSKDIPCTFGLFYHLRDGLLISTTLMRSNNAFLLLPYNLFEFSLLAEVVARQLKVPLGRLTHHAVSMHVYEDEYERAQAVVNRWNEGVDRPSFTVEMPTDPEPLGQILKLVILEAELRHGSAALSGSNIEEWISRGIEQLHPYWRQLYYLLLLYVARTNEDHKALASLDTVIEEPWHSYLPSGAFESSTPSVPSTEELLALELPPEAYMARVIPMLSTRRFSSLKSQAADWQAKGNPISWEEYSELQESFLPTIAARYDEEVTAEEFASALNRIRRS